MHFTPEPVLEDTTAKGPASSKRDPANPYRFSQDELTQILVLQNVFQPLRHVLPGDRNRL